MKGIGYVLMNIIAALVVLATVSSCHKDKTPPPVPIEPEACSETVSFAGKVEPIIQQNCSTSGCHNAASSSGTYNLEGYGNISTNASDILSVIRHESGPTPMPLGSPKLNDSIIEQINCWIEQGKLNN